MDLLVDFPDLMQLPTKSYWIATTQRHITSKRSARKGGKGGGSTVLLLTTQALCSVVPTPSLLMAFIYRLIGFADHEDLLPSVRHLEEGWGDPTHKQHAGAFKGSRCALCPRCAKSRLFSTAGSHGSQGPELCTAQPLLVHQGISFLSLMLPTGPRVLNSAPHSVLNWSCTLL